MYAVLVQKVLTDKGKAIVRAHEADYDAQKVYKELFEHHTKSTQAKMDSSDLLSYITSVSIEDWRGTMAAFILHWQDQVRWYEQQIPTVDHMSGPMKRTLLENAVKAVDDLRAVKTTADIQKTQTGVELTYKQYAALLQSAATAHDSQLKPKKSKQTVLQHQVDYGDEELEFNYGEPGYDPEPFEGYDIDAPIHSVQANLTDRRQNQNPTACPVSVPRPTSKAPSDPKARMPFSRWRQLSEKAKSIWDSLSNEHKAIILGNTNNPTLPDCTGRRDIRSVNLNEISVQEFLDSNFQDLDIGEENFQDAVETPSEPPPPDSPEQTDSTILINAAHSSKPLTPGDIRRILSTTSKRSDPLKPQIEGHMHQIIYHVSKHTSRPTYSLVDRGANGGIAGDDVRVMHKTARSVDVQGIDNHQINDKPIGTVGGVVTTQKGPVIAIFHQYALFGTGSSIHSCGQLEWFKNDVNDESIHVQGGLQHISTPEGYVIPLSIQNGLVRLDIRPYTDDEFDTLPHVILTSEMDWDPAVLDHTFEEDEEWFDAVQDLERDPAKELFDEYGNYRHRVVMQAVHSSDSPTHDPMDALIYNCVIDAMTTTINTLSDFWQASTGEVIDHRKDTVGEPPPDTVKKKPLIITPREPNYLAL